jgi:hypothetical protein
MKKLGIKVDGCLKESELRMGNGNWNGIGLDEKKGTASA